MEERTRAQNLRKRECEIEKKGEGAPAGFTWEEAPAWIEPTDDGDDEPQSPPMSAQGHDEGCMNEELHGLHSSLSVRMEGGTYKWVHVFKQMG